MSCFDLESLIKVPTCFQSANPICIDLILTNKKKFFKNSNVVEVGISDHYNLVRTTLKSHFDSPKMKLYPDYEKSDLKTFKTEISTVLSILKRRRLFKFSRDLY